MIFTYVLEKHEELRIMDECIVRKNALPTREDELKYLTW
jgi:hypothetical protein